MRRRYSAHSCAEAINWTSSTRKRTQSHKIAVTHPEINVISCGGESPPPPASKKKMTKKNVIEDSDDESDGEVQSIALEKPTVPILTPSTALTGLGIADKDPLPPRSSRQPAINHITERLMNAADEVISIFKKENKPFANDDITTLGNLRIAIKYLDDGYSRRIAN
ncbi:hypothetical protein PENTCL1PPCAC_21997 [Pristionchus entomophagus]|uniref:Ribosomal protein n=1 Tax=Pristionchus entomophagus TaxID=358040 RepID=A0AAV5TZP6_9BILA|nr:hypothetical protein PENTCL1PPCAC_21997 [Pristionchus entomophagus]